MAKAARPPRPTHSQADGPSHPAKTLAPEAARRRESRAAAEAESAKDRSAVAAGPDGSPLEDADALGGGDDARITLNLASKLHGAGRWSEAYTMFERASALRAPQDQSFEIDVLLTWSRAHEAEGNLLGARALAQDAFARATAAALYASAAEAAYRAARLHGDPHPSDEVLAWVTRGLDALARAARSSPNRILGLLLRVRRAVTEGALTTPTVAIAEMEAILREASDLPDVRVTTLGYLADQYERREELDTAAGNLDEALELARKGTLLRHEGRLAIHAAVLAVTRQEKAAASRFFTRAVEIALNPSMLHVPLLCEIAAVTNEIHALTGGEAGAPLRGRVRASLAALEPFLPTTFSFQARRRRQLRARVDDLRLSLRGLSVRGLRFETCIVTLEGTRPYVPKGNAWTPAARRTEGKEHHLLPSVGVQALFALHALGGQGTSMEIADIDSGKNSESVETALRRLVHDLGKRGIHAKIVTRTHGRWQIADHRPLSAFELQDLLGGRSSREPRQLELPHHSDPSSEGRPKNT